MAEKSKADDPTKEEATKELQTSATVESDDDDVVEGSVAVGGENSSAAGPSSKTKKSKRKKIKEALTGKLSDPQAELKKAIDNLPPEQLAELLRMNPALAQELSGAQSGSSSDAANPESALAALKRLSLENIMTGLASSGKNVKDMASYKFWQTQPVPKFGEGEPGVVEEGPIKIQTVADVPEEPQKLVDGFEWDALDLTEPEQLKEVYELLNYHYVEDEQAMFRFKYSPSILKWALMPPGWTKDWHIGVRASQSRKLVAFIAAVPMKLRVRNKIIDGSEVNFLVIHKKLRAKRLTPVLIKEITRLINLKGVWQAIYTAGVVLPKPVSTARYYHRTLNWQKLYDVGFTYLPPNSKPNYQIRKFALSDQTAIKGLREMQPKDLDAVQKLLSRYLAHYDLAPELDKDELRHWLLDNKDPEDEQVIFSYVVENDKKITDFFSYYALDSSVINNTKHDVVRAAYLFYYATETGLTTPVDRSDLKTRLTDLVNDALILAKQNKFDVFNALSLMENALFLEQLKFGAGDGQLHYYLFNYRADAIAGGVDKNNRLDDKNLSGIGFVML